MCEEDQAGATCLSETEVEVVAKWRQGPRDSMGRALSPDGIPEGSERFWWLWLTGNADGAGALLPRFAEGYLRYMGFVEDLGPSYSVLDFDFDHDLSRLDVEGAEFAADSVALEPFRDAGGKMIVWHGWADAMVPPYTTLAWHEALGTRLGSEAAASGNATAGVMDSWLLGSDQRWQR